MSLVDGLCTLPFIPSFEVDSNTHIVFVHQGSSWYMPYAVHQAMASNPDLPVVVIGDASGLAGVRRIPVEALGAQLGDRFRDAYVHMSSNSEQFELRCWLRWFYVLRYMQEYDVDSIVHLDSDCLLYGSIADIRRTFPEVPWSCALMIPNQQPDDFTWVASGHVSYWTRAALEDFCEFALASLHEPTLLAQYHRKWERHQQNGILGGICDMTTLYLFWQSRQDSIINLAAKRPGGVVDHSINAASNFDDHEFVMEAGRKKIRFIDGRPCFFRVADPLRPQRVHVAHFQGGAKPYMCQYYTGPSFPGKMRTDLRVRLTLWRQRLSALRGER